VTAPSPISERYRSLIRFPIRATSHLPGLSPSVDREPPVAGPTDCSGSVVQSAGRYRRVRPSCYPPSPLRSDALRLELEARAQEVHALDQLTTDVAVDLLFANIPAILMHPKSVANGEPILHAPHV